MADRTEPTATRLAGRAVAYGLGTGLAVLLLVGIPTVLIPTPGSAACSPPARGTTSSWP